MNIFDDSYIAHEYYKIHYAKFSDEKLPNFIHNIINKLVDTLRDALNKIHETVEGIVGGALSKIREFVDKVIAVIREKTQKILDKITELQEEFACVKGIIVAIKNLIKQIEDDTKACVDSAMNQITSVKSEISKLQQEIIYKIDEVMGVADKCSNGGPLKRFACVLKNLGTLTGAVRDIVDASKEIIRIFGMDVTAIVEDTRVCVIAVSDLAHSQIEQISKDVDVCLAPHYIMA